MRDTLKILGVCVFISSLLACLIFGPILIRQNARNHQEETQTSCFRAWTKLTGNPHNLTQTEFFLLKSYDLIPKEIE